MPKKLEPDKTYGQKLIYLFAKLLFSRRSYSLTELANSLECSKPTILRLVDHIQRAYSVNIDIEQKGRQNFYSIKRTQAKLPHLNLTDSEFHMMEMCLAFTENLLGHDLFEEANRALQKSYSLLPDKSELYGAHFTTFRPGRIDYTPHQESIRVLIDAMDQRKICKILYKVGFNPEKTYYIKPLKLFSFRETLYLHAQKARPPEEPYKKFEYDPTLAIQRIKQVEMTDRYYDFPDNYNFDKVFNQQFGIMKIDEFEVEIEFTGYAAIHIPERIWSDEQEITSYPDENKIRIKLKASSEEEIIALVLSFDEEAKVIEPDWLIDKIKSKIDGMKALYA